MRSEEKETAEIVYYLCSRRCPKFGAKQISLAPVSQVLMRAALFKGGDHYFSPRCQITIFSY